jgi:hypothetical protein
MEDEVWSDINQLSEEEQLEMAIAESQADAHIQQIADRADINNGEDSAQPGFASVGPSFVEQVETLNKQMLDFQLQYEKELEDLREAAQSQLGEAQTKIHRLQEENRLLEDNLQVVEGERRKQARISSKLQIENDMLRRVNMTFEDFSEAGGCQTPPPPAPDTPPPPAYTPPHSLAVFNSFSATAPQLHISTSAQIHERTPPLFNYTAPQSPSFTAQNNKKEEDDDDDDDDDDVFTDATGPVDMEDAEDDEAMRLSVSHHCEGGGMDSAEDNYLYVEEENAEDVGGEDREAREEEEEKEEGSTVEDGVGSLASNRRSCPQSLPPGVIAMHNQGVAEAWAHRRQRQLQKAKRLKRDVCGAGGGGGGRGRGGREWGGGAAGGGAGSSGSSSDGQDAHGSHRSRANARAVAHSGASNVDRLVAGLPTHTMAGLPVHNYRLPVALRRQDERPSTAPTGHTERGRDRAVDRAVGRERELQVEDVVHRVRVLHGGGGARRGSLLGRAGGGGGSGSGSGGSGGGRGERGGSGDSSAPSLSLDSAEADAIAARWTRIAARDVASSRESSGNVPVPMAGRSPWKRTPVKLLNCSRTVFPSTP